MNMKQPYTDEEILALLRSGSDSERDSAIRAQRVALKIARLDHLRVNGQRLGHKANVDYLREMIELAVNALTGHPDDTEEALEILREALDQVPA